MTFLLEPEEAFEPLDSDTRFESDMARGSARLLHRLNDARGIPNPKPERSTPVRWTLPKARRLWPRWYKPPLVRHNAAELCRSVAFDFGLTIEELKGDGRHSLAVEARSVIARLLHERGLSYPQVARALGRTDHSTAINMVSRFDRYAQRNSTVEWSYRRHRQGTAE